MNQREKFDAIVSMRSIGQHTGGAYPILSAFRKALAEGRVTGTYGKRVVIVSNNPYHEYTFITDNP